MGTIDNPSAGGLRIVIGAPGSGKSALLGALVCAEHEQIVSAAPDTRRCLAARHPHGAPSPDPAPAAVHARGRGGADTVHTAPALQWRLPPPSEPPGSDGRGPAAQWTVPDLLTAVRALPAAPPLVLDALAEAEDPAGELCA